MGCDKIPHSVKVSITQFGEVTVHRSAVDKFAWAMLKISITQFGQVAERLSGAGPAGVTYREVGHSAPVSGA